MPNPLPPPDQVPQPDRPPPIEQTDEVLDPVLPVNEGDGLPSPFPDDEDDDEIPADLIDDTPRRAVRLWRRVLH